MRIAIISDIHGNLTALEATLADIAAQAADQIVCLGDVALLGPEPHGVSVRLRELGCPVVMGNCDTWMLDPPPPDPTEGEDAARMAEINRWGAAQLTEGDKAFFRSFQPTISLSLGGAAPPSPPPSAGEGDGGRGRTLLCFHGSPRSYDEILRSTTPDAELDEAFAGVRAAVLTGGHTHIQLLRRWRGALLLNPGSVGLPYDAAPPDNDIHNPAWAEYAVLTADGPRLSVDLRRVPYALDDLRRSILASGMPHAAWWASEWVAA